RRSRPRQLAATDRGWCRSAGAPADRGGRAAAISTPGRAVRCRPAGLSLHDPLDEQSSLNLVGGGRARDVVDDREATRAFELRKPRVAVREDVVEARRRRWVLRYYCNADDLAPLRVGQAHHGDIG